MYVGDRFTVSELFDLWRRFQHRKNAVEVLADFGELDTFQARQLIAEFRREQSEIEPPRVEFTPAKHGEHDFMW